ncbi:hypothetical protein WN51_04251 [Melipona quadrifasciata]|uniref:Uncharacterized protein n=1 Tax=Melipona quadrifasciata TaxID=166423 RepID=A0A0M8ZUH8_9HYME|nr:hypothetical protein WN51_04251 [Melipona quadrifasciata]
MGSLKTDEGIRSGSRPTSSRHEPLPQDILQAEVVGRNGSCSKYRPQCPVGLFDLIGVLG